MLHIQRCGQRFGRISLAQVGGSEMMTVRRGRISHGCNRSNRQTALDYAEFEIAILPTKDFLVIARDVDCIRESE